MARREIQRDSAVKRLAAHLLRTGLAETSLRQLAEAAGISDRMLLYYFTDKADAVAAALQAVAAELAEALEAAIPAEPKLSSAALIAKTAALALEPSVRPFMSLWIQIIAAASRQEAPYPAIAGVIAAGFGDWVQARLACTDERDLRAQAAAVIAIADGLALVGASMGEERAREAAATLGNVTLMPLPRP